MPAAGRICGESAGPVWCTDAVFSRGLCRRHYRRAAKRMPLDPDDGRQVGVTASGYGTWGTVTVEDERLLCHECGGWYRSLAVHIGMVHEGVRAYRLAHGLLMSTPLVAPDISETTRARARDRRIVSRLEDARSPATLAVQDPEMIVRGVRLRRARGGR